MPAAIVAGLAAKGAKKAVGWLGRKLFGKGAKKVAKKAIAAAETVGPILRDTAIGAAGYGLGRRSGSMPTTFPGQPYGGGYSGPSETMAQSYAVCNIKGHHMNKSDYFLKSGEFIEKGTKCVRNRRMNPLNGHAARRAISRIKGARKMLNRIERSLPKRKASCGGRCSTRRK